MSVIAVRSATLLALAAALTGVVQSASLLQQDLLFTRAQTEVSFWGRGEYQPTPATIRGTEQQINQLVAITPDHPEYLSVQANSLAWQAYWAEDKETTQRYGNSAVNAQYQALESRPAHGRSWEKLAEYSASTEGNEALVLLGQSRLAQLKAKAKAI